MSGDEIITVFMISPCFISNVWHIIMPINLTGKTIMELIWKENYWRRGWIDGSTLKINEMCVKHLVLLVMSWNEVTFGCLFVKFLYTYNYEYTLILGRQKHQLLVPHKFCLGYIFCTGQRKSLFLPWSSQTVRVMPFFPWLFPLA